MKWKFWQSNDTDITQDHSEANDNKGPWGTVTRVASALIGLYLLGAIATGIFWSLEPAGIDAFNTSGQESATASEKSVTGSTTTATFIAVTEKMLNKSGGYLSNDIFPPGVWLDNMHNWEFGVLTLLRDTARVYRNDLSRSQSQSAENKNLAEAEGKFFFKNDSWFLPSTENTYAEGIDFFKVYQQQLANNQNNEAQFYARADNLAGWLLYVELRLGSLSQNLSASVGQQRINTNTSGETGAMQSTPTPSEQEVKTPWLKIDDVFYESRGATWALMHFLKAVELDFQDVLADKNATASLRQIIREMEE